MGREPAEGGSEDGAPGRKAEQWSGDQVREGKAPMELNPARDVEDDRRSFYGCVGDERKTRENMGPLQKGTGDLVTWDMEKAKGLGDFFASVFTGKGSRHSARAAEGKGRGKEEPQGKIGLAAV